MLIQHVFNRSLINVNAEKEEEEEEEDDAA